DFILATAARYLRRRPQRSDIRSQFAGLRPLIGGSGNTSSLSREHVIQIAPSGLVSVAGGKWTTYRRMGEEIIDQAATVAGLPARPCRTRSLILHGSPPSPSDDVFGTDRPAVDALPGAGRQLHPALSLSEAEVRFAAREEQARDVEDVLARRHRALFVDATAASEAAPAVAAILAEELDWDTERTREMTEAFHRLAEGFR
ncbi:MAG: FAD-dependent oxidoreductase, partial [Rhodocyclaceae bacterium]